MEGASSLTHAGIPDHLYRRRWWTLVVLCTSLIIVIVGNTALNVALPTLAKELNATTTQLQWMVDSYSLVFAGLLFTAGALGDRYGRKGALQIGLLIFLSGSLTAAFVGTANGVIAGRAIMGLGGAFVMPSTLSVLANVFPPEERTRAIAIWAGISGGGAALGPVVSGFLLRHFSWGSVFLVNVPIIAIALIAGRFLVPSSSDPESAKLDPFGAVLSIAALVSLVYAIIEAPRNGWLSASTLALFGAAVVLIAAFVWWELHNRHPMLDLRWFRDRRFSVASGGIVLVFFSMFGLFFLLTQYFQLVLGYNTLQAGIAQLPFGVVLVLVAPQTPRLSTRIGSNKVVALGLLSVTAGMLLLTTYQADSPYVWVLVPMLFLSGGMALTLSPLTGSIISAVPASRAGVGSAMNDTTRELGGALGVAVLGSLLLSSFQSEIGSALANVPAAGQDLARNGLAEALQVASKLDPAAAGNLVSQAKEAFLSGLGLAGVVGAAVAFVASIIVWRLLPAYRGVRPMVAEPARERVSGPEDLGDLAPAADS